MDNFQVETAQNVSIYQNVAGIGERILALLVDVLVIVAYSFVASFMMSYFIESTNDNWEIYAFSLVIGLPIFLYDLIMETFWDGRTFGKAALRLRVVKLDGSKPGFGSYFSRWILHLIEVKLMLGSIALVTILLNEKGQRLGDMAAGTTVISEKKKARLSDTLLVEIPENYIPTYPQVTVFTDKDMQRIKTVYTDAKRQANHNVIVKLSAKMQELMGITPEEKPIEFVDRVIADYNFYTQQ